MDKNYNNFFKTYNIYKDCWKSIDIRIMCMKDSSGVWNNLITNINPIPNTIKKCSEFTHLLSIDNLQITQKFDSIANFDQILNQVLSGQLVIDDMQINYSRLFEPKQPYNYIYHNSNRKQANDSFNLDNRYFYLEGHGEEMRQFIDRDQKEYIDSVLKSGDVPYNGLQDFAENFLFFNRRNPSDWYNYSTSCKFELMIPIILDYDKNYIDKSNLFINVITHKSVNLNKIKIGAIFYPRDRINSGTSKKFNKKNIIEEENDNLILNKKFYKKNIIEAEIFLSYNNDLVDEQIVIGPFSESFNVQHKIHGIFDKDHKVFKKYLKGEVKKGNKADTFENAVLWLFNFLGFYTNYYGKSSIKEEIDIIAISPDYNRKYILAIECTISDIDNKGKLTKLSRRTKLLRKELKDWEIIPVIATQLEYDDISDDHKTSATREKIVLLSIESLEYYLTNSHRFYNFNFLYNEIKKLIPNTSIGLKRHM